MMTEVSNVIPEIILSDREANWQAVHEAAIIFDLQAHPALKACEQS